MFQIDVTYVRAWFIVHHRWVVANSVVPIVIHCRERYCHMSRILWLAISFTKNTDLGSKVQRLRRSG